VGQRPGAYSPSRPRAASGSCQGRPRLFLRAPRARSISAGTSTAGRSGALFGTGQSPCRCRRSLLPIERQIGRPDSSAPHRDCVSSCAEGDHGRHPDVRAKGRCVGGARSFLTQLGGSGTVCTVLASSASTTIAMPAVFMTHSRIDCTAARRLALPAELRHVTPLSVPHKWFPGTMPHGSAGGTPCLLEASHDAGDRLSWTDSVAFTWRAGTHARTDGFPLPDRQ